MSSGRASPKRRKGVRCDGATHLGDGVSRKPNRVYALRATEKSPPMYIGCTEKSLDQRFKAHLSQALSGIDQMLVYRWLRSIDCQFVITQVAVTDTDCSDVCRRTGLVVEAAMTAAAARRTLAVHQKFIANCQNNPFRLKTGEINAEQAEAFLIQHCGKRRGARILANAIAADSWSGIACASEAAR